MHCPVWQCEVYDYFYNSTKSNGIRVDEYDAIIFSHPTWDRRATPLPSVRSPHQRYIFWSNEAPTYNKHGDPPPGQIFNLTMTYKWDSDIVRPYGWIYPEESTQDLNINYAKGKTKLIAWFVSQCLYLNGRKEYVRRLQEFVPVDIYGRCGTLQCPYRNDTCREEV